VTEHAGVPGLTERDTRVPQGGAEAPGRRQAATRIPAGTFQMGTDPTDEARLLDSNTVAFVGLRCAYPE
jgi:hypothetical protein